MINSILTRSKKTQNDFLREYCTHRSEFLQALLEGEAPHGDGICWVCKSKQGLIKCLDCFGRHLACRECCISEHQNHPFHRVELWNGSSFLKSSLYKLGFVMYLGHGGQTCPCIVEGGDIWEDVELDPETGFCPEDWQEIPEEKVKKGPENTLVIVDSLGVFRHRIGWCQCPGALDHKMQLFHDSLFPASLDQPSSAFTFSVLDHFYIDAMECKTAAHSFFRKLCRITNNAFPNNVPVCKLKYSTS
jgi:hypothetical protein